MKETDEALYSRYLETDDDGDLEILLARHREGLLLFLLGFVRNPEGRAAGDLNTALNPDRNTAGCQKNIMNPDAKPTKQDAQEERV